MAGDETRAAHLGRAHRHCTFGGTRPVATGRSVLSDAAQRRLLLAVVGQSEGGLVGEEAEWPLFSSFSWLPAAGIQGRLRADTWLFMKKWRQVSWRGFWLMFA
jgi:hypothetical protein